MRILSFVIPEKGHLNPLLPTLRRLASAGHELVVASTRDLTSALQAAGLPARVALLNVPPPAAGFLTAGQEFADKLRDPAWLASWIEALLIDTVPAQLPAVRELLTREQPDVVLADPMLYAVAIACGERELPWAAVSSSLNPVTPRSWSTALTNTLHSLSERRASLFRTCGVPVPRFFVSDAESPFLNIAFSAQAYLAEPPDPAIELVGAPFDDSDLKQRGDAPAFPWHKLGTARRLYCSFGSQAFFQPRLFGQVFAASRALGLQVVASVGDLLDDPQFVASAPHDAVLVRFAPQLELLSQVDLVVSHGGANSVVETLRSGRPLLLLTLCNDQPLQGRFLTAAGAGLVLDAAQGEVPADALLAALRQLLTGPERDRARTLAIALRDAGGPTRAAALVEALGKRSARAKERAHG